MRTKAFAMVVLCVLVGGAARADSLCTADMAEAMSLLVSSVQKDRAVVFVEPEIWDMVDFEKRRAFAFWAARCLIKARGVSIRHGKTGKELATWAEGWGYSVKE